MAQAVSTLATLVLSITMVRAEASVPTGRSAVIVVCSVGGASSAGSGASVRDVRFLYGGTGRVYHAWPH